MNARTNKGFASRTGYALGAAVRFIAFDDQPARRWGKRLVLLALVSLALYFSFSWVAGIILNLICIVLVLLEISKVDTARLSKSSDTPTAPHSRDVFGYKLDWLGHRVEYRDIEHRD
ncbi:TPA: hypothetical protein NIG49_006242 [Pseudomonas aeruginosa]|nr:hypothetical protein [Pseudomonas aeruginosa]HCF5273109.1 hypothetical protein [Pseudomonas aeruginosa]HCF7348846.1 hypothetical protein [Pseudomonas aeruginosa]HCF7352330.1 hypothetical protein [Pseudomonas aeruginosa]